ncbi:MAG: glycosyltransferase family 2 protein, partial [Halieaceae bacterium]
MRRPISCFVITCNEADRIEQCLQSVAGWVDELLVVDSGSTDSTLEIARKYADRVYETDWPGFGPQRNRALDWCEHDWVLSLDADEVVTEALRHEVDTVLSEPNLSANFIKF